MVTLAWHSKLFWTFSEWLISYMIFFWIWWTFEKGYKSVEVMEWSWGCTWGVPKCVKMDQKWSKINKKWAKMVTMSWPSMIFFWGRCILVHLMWETMTPPLVVLTPIPFQGFLQSINRSDKLLRTNSKQFCSVMLYWPFWTILVHFGPFWRISVWAMTPPWLVLTHIMCPSNPDIDVISHYAQQDTKILGAQQARS